MDLDLLPYDHATVQKRKQRVTVSGEGKVKEKGDIASFLVLFLGSSPAHAQFRRGTAWNMCNVKSRHEVDTHAHRPVHIFRNSQSGQVQGHASTYTSSYNDTNTICS